mgnify:CR=1 FL=1
MKKQKRGESQSEAMRQRWERRIVAEKGYDGNTAEWMALRLEALLDHMLYGHALIAYHKQNGEFRLVKATLVHYRGGLPQGIRSRQNRWCRCPLGCRTTELENFPGGEFP